MHRLLSLYIAPEAYAVVNIRSTCVWRTIRSPFATVVPVRERLRASSEPFLRVPYINMMVEHVFCTRSSVISCYQGSGVFAE
jgi:hypothetical protein